MVITTKGKRNRWQEVIGMVQVRKVSTPRCLGWLACFMSQHTESKVTDKGLTGRWAMWLISAVADWNSRGWCLGLWASCTWGEVMGWSQ